MFNCQPFVDGAVSGFSCCSVGAVHPPQYCYRGRVRRFRATSSTLQQIRTLPRQGKMSNGPSRRQDDNFFVASSGTVILVAPTSLISTVVVRLISRSLSLKLMVPCKLNSYFTSSPSLTQNFTEPLALLTVGPLSSPGRRKESNSFAPASVKSPA